MRFIGCVLLLLSGCFSPLVQIAPSGDAGTVDAGAVPEDSGTPVVDSGTVDSGTPVIDAGTPDAGTPDAGGGLFGSACVLSDGGTDTIVWCREQATNLRRCSDVTLIFCFEHVMAMAVDSSWLVWSTQGGGIYARPVAGGLIRKLDQFSAGTIAVSVEVRDGYAYWAETTSTAFGSVYRVALNGGSRETLATGQQYAHALAVDATHLYWADRETIYRLALAGGTAQPFISGQTTVNGLALDATHLYWGNSDQGLIRRVPLTGGTPATLFSQQMMPWKLRIANGYVYWTSDFAPTDIKRGPVTGGVAEVLVTNQDVPREMVTDGVWLYWFAQGTNFGQPAPRIYRMPVAGGTPPEILLTPKRGGPLVMDATTLYFGSEGVWSLPR